MLLKLLGILDIIVAILFFIDGVFNKSSWMPSKIILYAGIYLLIKGLIFVFMLDFLSVIDIACSLIILLSILIHIPFLLVFIVVFFLIQKGLLSLVA
jgi:hypothetical protein